jgi:hypothetical protein
MSFGNWSSAVHRRETDTVPIDPNEARTVLHDLNFFLAWMSAIALVALMGWWLSESSPRDEGEGDHAPKADFGTYTGELINQLMATVNRVFRRKRLGKDSH